MRNVPFICLSCNALESVLGFTLPLNLPPIFPYRQCFENVGSLLALEPLTHRFYIFDDTHIFTAKNSFIQNIKYQTLGIILICSN